MDQACDGIVQAPVEADDKLEVRIGVLVDLSIGSVEDLLDQPPLAGENCPWTPHTVARHIVLFAAAELHGDELALQVVVQRCDQIAAVVVHVAHPGGVGQIGIKELQLLAVAALGGHAAAQPIVAVPHGVLSHSVEHSGEQAVGVVFEQVVGPLPEEAVIIHTVLQLAEVRDAVPLVVAQRRQSGIKSSIYLHQTCCEQQETTSCSTRPCVGSH